MGFIQPTAYDLMFSVFGIPVRVHPAHWLVAAVMIWPASHQDLRIVVLGVICVFFSVLVHELGHAIVAKLFGWPPSIVLYHFGGVAMYSPTGGHTPWRAILISIMGPGAQLMLGGAATVLSIVMLVAGVTVPDFASQTISILIFISIAWALLNLAPVLPLDGGRICEQVLVLTGLRNPQLWALRIGIVTAGLIAYGFLSVGETFAGLLFVFLCINNIQAMQSIRGGR